MSDNPPAHKYPVGTKVRLTEPVDVGASIIDEKASRRADKPIVIDRTYIEVTGSFYVVQLRRDCNGITPLYVLCPFNDPEDFEKLRWNLYNISEEQLVPEPITLTNPKLTPPAPSQTR